MRKRVIAATMSLLFLATTGAYAHLTGAFADFLVTVHDESTTEKLKQELAETQREAEKLRPRLQQLKAEYEKNQGAAIEKMLFYREMGLDAGLQLMLLAEEPVDLLGSLWLIEQHLEAYLEELNKLYLDYQQVRITAETLQGHRQLLSAIEENLRARSRFLADNPDVPLDQLANYLDIDWMSEVEPHLLPILEQDRELTQREVRQWATAQAGSGPFRLTQSWLNERSELTYFFRADHIYVVYQKPGIHVILIGQVLQGSGDAAELTFEAGFFNGFLMPETLIEELTGFRVPYDQLRLLSGVTGAVYLQQGNGELLLRAQ